MDTTDREIVFNDDGTCNHCTRIVPHIKWLRESVDQRRRMWEQIAERIRTEGKGKPYDCLIGVSGGMDSSYVAILTKEWGLRPLAVHVDNGWNSELAVHNVKRLLDTLGIDLETIVLDWEEFRNLQVAFLRASTPDGEIPTDHAIVAGMYHTMRKHKIKYLLEGGNPYSESILARTWSMGHYDWKYVSAINKRFGQGNRLRTFPHINAWQYMSSHMLQMGRKSYGPLHFLEFDRETVKRQLAEQFNWRFYGGKHYESAYTKFYQGVVLPQKFNIDKRKGHLSSYICAGMTTREEALKELAQPPYPPEDLEADTEYVCKKLGLSRSEYDGIMKLPHKLMWDYPNNSKLFSLPKWGVMKPVKGLVRRFFKPERKAFARDSQQS
jgi:N-acetyl sugar amidotransferase